MEWHKKGLSESINSLWAWSINTAKFDMPSKKIRNTNTYNYELNSTLELAVCGVKKFADSFLKTSYDINLISECSILTKNLHVKHLKKARVLFFKKFNNIHMHSNTDIFILRKRNGIHYSQTCKDLKNYRQNADSVNTFNKMPESIFYPFE